MEQGVSARKDPKSIARSFSITQTWNGVAHTWASFGWDNLTMQPTVNGIVGTYNGEVMPVLKMVAFHDGTYTKFLYNGNGQVERVTQYASDSNPLTDNHERSHTVFNYNAGDDATRLTDIRVAAEYWTGFNGVPNEVTTQFGVEGDKHTVTVVGDPNGTVYKERYAAVSPAAWQRGLILETEVWSAGVQRKLSTVSWAQDNTSVNYKTNPRVTQTIVSDGANVRKTTIDYSNAAYAQFGLPYIVREYAADGMTELRRTYRDYNLNQEYLDRRIIGLVSAVHMADANGFQAKVTYGYDDQARLSLQATTATMHDQSYHASFFMRGNVTSVTRWDVTDINNGTKALTSYMNYSAAGSVVSTTDPAGHANQVNYADSFSDGNNSRNTFAYPTAVTDADNFSSTIQYNFDFGARTRIEGPPPENQLNGIIQTFAYDSAARLQRTTTANTGAYTHHVYGPNFVQSYSSVNNVAANYWESDLYSITVFDGGGRGFTTTTNHPGSNGGYKLVNVIFDRMGRPLLQSNPTEVNSAWLPTGDDAVGVRYSVLDFDWQGRTTRKTHPDGAYEEASYAGCGCAGGEVVTLTDEVNRQQKVYSDVLGRNWKTEVMTWPDGSGNRSVHSTTTQAFNARDQVTLVRQWSGMEGGGAYQDTTMSYDGYARLQSKHVAEQNAGANTTYEYFSDDRIQKVTDARGASVTYHYPDTNRHLPKRITYDAGASGAAVPGEINFSYDAAGNRTSMNDGSGSTTYAYDSLSRLQSETKTFNGISGSYSLSYGYNLAGEVTSLSDPTNAAITYSHDSIGRVNNVTGSPYGTGGVNGVPYLEISQYAANLQYRASGALKAFNYGNGLTLAMNYDARMRPSDFEIAGRPPQFGPPTVMKSQYQYHADNNPKYARDLLDERFDRAFSFDHRGALKEGYSGSEARDYVNNTNSGAPTGPFRQTYQHDSFGNMTNRENRFWSRNDAFAASYVNHRRQGAAFQYDAAGNLTQDEDLQYAYDAAGRNASIFSSADNKTITPTYDGLGQPAKREETQNGVTNTTYYVWSSVLGKVVTELNGTGGKLKTYVYLGGKVVAFQVPNWIVWQHDNPITGSRGSSDRNGGYGGDIEPDPMGVDVGFYDPFIQFPEPPPPSDGGPVPMLMGDQSGCGANPNCTRCYLDGFEIGCAEAGHLMQIGAAQFRTPTTVYVTYTNGNTDTFTGYSDLPPGSYFNFTGDYARAAGFVFDVLNMWTGNFNLAVNTAIASADVVRNSPMDISGRAFGWRSFAFSFAPQNTGFLVGRFGFNANERERLGRAYDKITSDACRKFFDETLARMTKNGEIRSQYPTTPTTLAGILAITTLNRYSSNLTAARVEGISQQRWNDIRNKFESGAAAAVTLGGDGRVFLGDNAFYQPGSIAQLFYKAGDLPGIIVHEFFHRAGLTESQVKALNPEIQKNCGNPKDAL